MSNKGILYPSNKEIDYFRSNFNEGASMLGKKGKLYQIESFEVVNTDIYYTYKTPVLVNYFLIDRPKINVIKRYGWYTEDRDALPIICYITFKDDEDKPIELDEGCILEVSVRSGAHVDTEDTLKWFIGKPYVDMDMNMFICKLSPYRENTKPNNELTSTADPAVEDKWFDRGRLQI